MKYSKVLAALAFSAIISAESVALEPVRHTVFSTDMVTGMYNLDRTIPVVVKVAIYDGTTSVYEEQHTVTVNSFGFLQFEIGKGLLPTAAFADVLLTPSLIVKTYVVDGTNNRIIDSKRMSEIIYNANVSRYSHMVNLSPAERLTGANVIDQIKVDEHGVLTTTTRALTPADINAASTTQLTDSLALKVDKVTGKGLSANDFTNDLKTKLDGIATGAEVNVNADWTATSGDAQILNKPTDATETVGGLMSAADKAKLNGIEANANKYIHPEKHPASIITQDVDNRFVSDADTANWNSKLTNSLDRGYIFIGNDNNKPEAKRGLEGEVLLSNGVYNSFAKIKDINVASDAAISGKKITPDFGQTSNIIGGELSVGDVNVLRDDNNNRNGNVYAEGKITADGGFEGELTTTGNVVAGDINIVKDPGVSDGSLTAEGTITALDGLISDGDITGVNITATGNITGVDITATGNVKGVDVTATGDAIVSGSVLAGEISIGKDIVLGTTGNLSADGTITAAEGFIGTLQGNAETATNLTPGGADKVYLGVDATTNTWGKIKDAHIDANAGIVDTKLATIATAGKVANTATTATNAKTANAIVARDAQGGFVAGNVTVDQLSTANGSTAGMIVGETAGTAWANVNKGGKAVLEMGLGTDGTNPAGYGIKINDNDGVTNRVGMGRNPLGWVAGVSGTTHSAGALVDANGANARLAVATNAGVPVFSADQTGKIAAAELALTAKATSAATVAGDAATTLTTKGYVDGLALTAGNGIDITAQEISAKLDGNTLSNGANGLSLNLGNPNTWTAAQTVTAKVTANEFSTATGRFVTGETLNTAWANVNKGANAVLEMGLGKTGLAAPNDRDGYGITINDDAGANRAGMGRNPLGWVAGVSGTTHSAGALVNADGTNARLMVADAAGNPVFTAGQNGEVTATTFNGNLNGAAATLAATLVAGNSAVAAINKSTVTKIAGAKVDPDFGAQNISGQDLNLTGNAFSIAPTQPTHLTTKKYVDDIEQGLMDLLTEDFQPNALDEAQIWIGNGDAQKSVGEAKTVTGDISINKDGLTAIAAGVVVNGDISATAGIAVSKLGFGAANTVVMTNGAGDAVTSGLIANANIAAAAGIAVSKLGSGAANTVVMTNGAGDAVTSGLIADANVSSDIAKRIAGTKIAPDFGAQNVVTTGTVNGINSTANADGFQVSGGTTSRTLAVNTGNVTLSGNAAGSSVTLPTSGTLATLAGAETLTNKTVNGLTPTANVDGFQVAGGTTSRTLVVNTGNVTLSGNAAGSSVTLPTTGTLATLAGAETLTNKTVNGLTPTANVDGFQVAGGTTSRTLVVNTGNVTLSGNAAGSSVTLPTTGTLATLAGAEELTNKTLTTPTMTVADNAFTLQDNADATKKAQFELTGITAGQTRVLTVPDYNGTIATLAGVETLTNKTLTSPVINGGVALTATSTQLNALNGVTTAGTNIIKIGNGNANEFLKTNGDGTVAWAAVPSNLHDAYDGGNTITTDLGRNVIIEGNAALEVTATLGIITNKLSASVQVASASFKSEPAVGNSTSITGGNLTSTYNGTDPAFQINSTNNLNTNAALQVSSNAGSDGVGGNLGQVARFDLDNSLNNDAAVSISTTGDGTDARGLDVQALGNATGVYVGASNNSAIEVSSGNVTLSVVSPASVAGGITLANYSSVYIIGAGAGAPFGVTLPNLAKEGTIIFVRNNSGFNATLNSTPATVLVANEGATLIFDGANWLAL